MAQVRHRSKIQEQADDYLTYLIREWQAVPRLATEWTSWDDLDQLDFVVEWPIREDRLQQLQQWAEQNFLTSAQCTRYEELLRLVAQYRPTLERLLAK